MIGSSWRTQSADNASVLRSAFGWGEAIVSAFSLALFVVCSAQGFAQSDVPSVDTERVIKRHADSTWYDANENSYVKPRIGKGEPDNSIRTDGRLAEPKSAKAKKAKSSKTGNTGGGGFGGLRGLGDFFSGFTLFWLGLLLIAIIAALAYFSFRNYLPSRNKDQISGKEIKIDPTRIEDLPFEVPEIKAFSNPLEQIQALMQAGRVREAVILLYGYKLLTLDQANRIELQKGKTNRTYLREVKSHQRIASILETTMLAFEDAFFGDHEISQERFQQSWSLLDEFQQLALNSAAKQ